MKNLSIFVIAIISTLLFSCEKRYETVVNNNIEFDVDSILRLIPADTVYLAPPQQVTPMEKLSSLAANGNNGEVIAFILDGENMEQKLNCSSDNEILLLSVTAGRVHSELELCDEYDLTFEPIGDNLVELHLEGDLSGLNSSLSLLEYDNMKISYFYSEGYITFVLVNEDDPSIATIILKLNNTL